MQRPQFASCMLSYVPLVSFDGPSSCIMASLFGHTAKSIVENPEFAPLNRDLQVCEIFSGVGSIHRAATKHHLFSAEYDIERQPGVTDTGSAQSEVGGRWAVLPCSQMWALDVLECAQHQARKEQQVLGQHQKQISSSCQQHGAGLHRSDRAGRAEKTSPGL